MKRAQAPITAKLIFTASLAPIGALAGCGLGHVTESIESLDRRDLSGIAMPGDTTKLGPVSFVPREIFGSANSPDALGYPGLPPEGRALMDAEDLDSPLRFFTFQHTDEEGVGPLFNQRRCLGCHFSSEDIKANGLQNSLGFTTLNTVNTPVSRAARQGPTNYDYIFDNYRPNTAAFTLFGDYFPAGGMFDPLAILGGPLQHVETVGVERGCKSADLPSLSSDPILQGGIDPVTGLSPLGARREVGERAGPPYIGRGLMEAIYYEDIVKNEDLRDALNETEPCVAGAPPPGLRTCSSLPPAVDHAICPGDCVSGRHNEGRADLSMVGGDPEVRLGRFGLRAAGTTMAQFDVGGTQGEIGFTSILLPTEQTNIINGGVGCDQIPDPELRVKQVLDLRAMIRLFGPPDYAKELRQSPPQGQLATDIQAGARLFGVDLEAFLSRTTKGATPVRLGDIDADRGMAKDRMLNCVACHIPIQKTGQSPATIGGELLSNKWAPIFSDLLIHKNPSLPQGKRANLNPLVTGTLNRDLSDFVVAPPVTGIAAGDEFRTPPLMGIGKTGPPFLHDARVYVNVIHRRIPVEEQMRFPNDRGVHPAAPPEIDAMATTVFGSAGSINKPLALDTVDHAIQAAIELHDLPAPPDNDYTKCPNVPADRDICSRSSRYRGDARNTIEKWHMLTDAQQLQVIRFLESL